MKNHALKNQANGKKKYTKEADTIHKKLHLILRDRATEQSKANNLAKKNAMDVNGVAESNGVESALTESGVYVKEEVIFPSNSFCDEFNEHNHMDETSNAIDLMDISKCIMEIEQPKYEMAFEQDNSTSDEYKIEAIKKYLIEQPAEYVDLSSLQSVKHEYFNSF